MKKIILAFACLVPFVAMAQGGYTISGKMLALNGPAKAHLLIFQGKAYKDQDSVTIKAGKFQFKGTVNEPVKAIVEIKYDNAPKSRNQSDRVAFQLENSNISITATDSFKDAKISGLTIEREKQELSASIRPFTDKIIKLQNEFAKENKASAEKTAEERKAAADSINSYVKQIRDININFVKSHPNSYMGLYTFNASILDSYYKPAEVKPLFYKLSPQLQSSPLGKQSIDRILASEKRGVGVKLFDFSQTDINGNPFKISSLRGKYVFIDFWASWCHWCRVENPNVLKAYEQLKGKNLEMVSVSFDDNKAAWEYAVKQDKLPWLQVSDLKGMQVRDGLAAMLDFKSIPKNLLINPEGIIIGENLHGEDLAAKLSALIK